MQPLRRALAAALLLLVGCGEAAPAREREIWRFAIEETRGSVQDMYALRFEREIEARSGGAVDVVVYPYGALGTSDHLLEQVHNGTLQLAMSSPGHLGKLIPALQVFLLHFVLGDGDDAATACALADPAVTAQLRALYADKGLAFCDAFTEGQMVWTTRKPVRTPADLAGTKIRVMTSPLLITAYAAYGAHPVPLPYSEVYSALQLRMIDGQVNPVFAIQEMSFHEVTDWMIFPRHAAFVTTLAGNPRFLARLTPERRALFDDVVRTLHVEIGEVQRRFNAERLAQIAAGNPAMQFLSLSEPERDAFRALAAPVRDHYIALAGAPGRALLSGLEEALARCRR